MQSAIRVALMCWCIAFVLNCAWTIPAIGALNAVPRERVFVAQADAQFFLDYPDLRDEREQLEAASRELTAEGFQPAEDRNAKKLLAERTRRAISQRTAVEWQQKAISLYPDLGIAGSEFNLLFLRHHRELQESTPAFSEEPSWPLLLARRCADELRAKKQPNMAQRPDLLPAATLDSSPALPPRSITEPVNPPPVSSSAREKVGGVSLTLAGAVLIIIVLLPCLPILRWTRLRQSTDGAATRCASSPYHRAIKPAIIVYGVAAIAAIIRSLPANGDLSLMNRFFITLCISLVFGVCAGLVGYLSALLYCALRPRDGGSHAHTH